MTTEHNPILVQLSTVFEVELPMTKRRLMAIVRKADKAPKDVWNKLDDESTLYLQNAIKSQKQKKSFPLPKDVHEWKDGTLMTVPETHGKTKSQPVQETETETTETNEEDDDDEEGPPAELLHQPTDDDESETNAPTEPDEDSDEDDSKSDDDEQTTNEMVPVGFSCEYTTKVVPIESLILAWNQNRIGLPELQRKFVWPKKKRQSFMTSLLRGVPIQNIMLVWDPTVETKTRLLLDGQQRMTTIKRYIDGKDRLGPGIPELNKKKFNELPDAIKEQLLSIDLAVLEAKTEQKYWGFIFRQTNCGGAPLTGIEVRRAIYTHPVMLMLDNMAETHEHWLSVYGGNPRYKGLGALVRALAMHFNHAFYQKPIETFLDRFCDSMTDEMYPPERIEKLENFLDRIIESIYSDIGKIAFRIESESKPPNSGLIDCMIHAGIILLLNQEDMSSKQLGESLNAARERFLLFPGVVDALKNDTSGRENVRIRMAAMDEVLTGLV